MQTEKSVEDKVICREMSWGFREPVTGNMIVYGEFHHNLPCRSLRWFLWRVFHSLCGVGPEFAEIPPGECIRFLFAFFFPSHEKGVSNNDLLHVRLRGRKGILGRKVE